MVGEISASLKNKISTALYQGPMERGDVRGIPSVPTHYIGLEETHDGRNPEFSVRIDGVTVHVFKAPRV